MADCARQRKQAREELKVRRGRDDLPLRPLGALVRQRDGDRRPQQQHLAAGGARQRRRRQRGGRGGRRGAGGGAGADGGCGGGGAVARGNLGGRRVLLKKEVEAGQAAGVVGGGVGLVWEGAGRGVEGGCWAGELAGAFGGEARRTASGGPLPLVLAPQLAPRHVAHRRAALKMP